MDQPTFPEYKAIIKVPVLELIRMKHHGKPTAWLMYEEWCKQSCIGFTRDYDTFTFTSSEDLLAFKIRFAKEITG